MIGPWPTQLQNIFPCSNFWVCIKAYRPQPQVAHWSARNNYRFRGEGGQQWLVCCRSLPGGAFLASPITWYGVAPGTPNARNLTAKPRFGGTTTPKCNYGTSEWIRIRVFQPKCIPIAIRMPKSKIVSGGRGRNTISGRISNNSSIAQKSDGGASLALQSTGQDAAWGTRTHPICWKTCAPSVTAPPESMSEMPK